MDEQVSWKGQSFTLLVFGGIVFLCSIFFVLGMLVGRGQGQRTAENAVLSAAARAADTGVKTSEIDARSTEAKSSNSPYEGIATGKETKKESSSSGTRDGAVEKPAAPVPEKAARPAVPKAAAVPPAAPAPAKTATAKTAAPTPVKMTYLQVGAYGENSKAKTKVDELRKAGFPAVVVGGDGPNALFKVQVGPFATTADAEPSRRKLVTMGYDPIRK